MNRPRLSVSVLAAAAMIGPGILVYGANAPAQSAKQPQSQTDAKSSSSQKSDAAPDGFVIVDERVITLTANEPQNHFMRAHEFLAQNDAHSAAAEVRIGASYLDMQASRDKGDNGKDSKESLSSAANQLRDVANQIQKQDKQDKSQGDTKEQKQLNSAFANANRALAEHFQSLAQNEIAGKKGIMAGNDLDAAGSSLAAACSWSGQAPSQAAMTAVNDAHRVAGELLSPNMPMEDNAAGQSASANKKGDKSTDAAEPASARMSSNSNETASNSKIPDDATKVIDALGNAIQETPNKSDQGANGTKASGQSGNAEKSKP